MAQVAARPVATQPTAQASLGGGDRLARTQRRRPRARRAGVSLAWFIVMLAFTAFFFVPVVWLLLAPTKTDHQLVFESPFAFGSFHTFLKTWDQILRVPRPRAVDVARELGPVLRRRRAVGIGLRRPGRLRVGPHRVPRPESAAHHNTGRDDHAR